MKYLTSLLSALAVGMFVSVSANAAVVGAATFDSVGDTYIMNNDVVPSVSEFPHDYSITTSLTARYHAMLSVVSGVFDDLNLQWLGLPSGTSDVGPVSVSSGGSVDLTPLILAGTNPTLRVNGAGAGTYHLEVTATPIAETPIPAAMVLLLSGLGVVGAAGFRRRNHSNAGGEAT